MERGGQSVCAQKKLHDPRRETSRWRRTAPGWPLPSLRSKHIGHAAGPLDDIPLEDLQQSFATIVKVQPRLATAHAKLVTHVLCLLNHALGDHRQSTQPETPQSLLRSTKLWYILPALLHSQDGRMKRRERFASAERGDLTFLLPWLMEYTRRTSTRKAAAKPAKRRPLLFLRGHHKQATIEGG